MIDIRLYNSKIIIKGHAGYEEPGKDIVCAAVSVLVDTFVLKNFNDLSLDTSQDYIEINLKKDIKDLEFIKKGFEYIEDAYPEYVRLKSYINTLVC